MNIITIDPSLICTAMIVDGKGYVYAGSHIAMTKKLKLTRWFEIASEVVEIRCFDVDNTSPSFSSSELAKMIRFIEICECIINDLVVNNVDFSNAKVFIEGYSYSSVSGPLIDLVTFGSILRLSFIQRGCIDINIIPPQEFKTKAASLVYKPIVKGKVTKYMNATGLSAGSFKKQDMLKCLLEDVTLMNDAWIKLLISNKDDMLALKSTPKPFEDINDAKLLYEWAVRNI